MDHKNLNANRVKYPRTYHLPYSLGVASDDKILKDTSYFCDREVLITEKMDGENTTLYSDYFHARSLDSRHHVSRDWLAKFHGEIGYKIPMGWRICGENLYAKHSIGYTELPSYFLAFSIWDENNVCLDWDITVEFLNELGIYHPKILYRGIYSDDIVRGIIDSLDLSKQEGFVVRLVDSFLYKDFSKSVAKFVRMNHVMTDEHWMNSVIIRNELV